MKYELHIKNERYHILEIEEDTYYPGGFKDINDAIAVLNLYNGIGITQRYRYFWEKKRSKWVTWDDQINQPPKWCAQFNPIHVWDEEERAKLNVEHLNRDHSFTLVPPLKPKLASDGLWKIWNVSCQCYTGKPGNSDRKIIQGECDRWNKAGQMPNHRIVLLELNFSPMRYKVELRENTGLGGSHFVETLGEGDIKAAHAIAKNCTANGDAAYIPY